MCGIVGYIGNKQAYPILIKGLRRLEYRGYDSAGVALINDNGNLNVCKTKGKVDNLEEYCKDKDVSGTVGIAHTRWATHGGVTGAQIHNIAAQVIADAGYGAYFGHGFGHSLGIEIHENPRFSPLWDKVIPAGACQTGDGHGNIRLQRLSCAPCHGLCHRGTDGAHRFQQPFINPQKVMLDPVGIADDAVPLGRR